MIQYDSITAMPCRDIYGVQVYIHVLVAVEPRLVLSGKNRYVILL